MAMQAYDLVDAARRSLPSTPGRPSEAVLRRALSTSYYALFHCLAHTVADLLVGGPQADRSEAAWRQAYRAIDHANVKKCCKNKKVECFPDGITEFANTFVEMQEKREKADYDPTGEYYKPSVENDIKAVEDAIAAFESASARDRRAFAVYVSMRSRRP